MAERTEATYLELFWNVVAILRRTREAGRELNQGDHYYLAAADALDAKEAKFQAAVKIGMEAATEIERLQAAYDTTKREHDELIHTNARLWDNVAAIAAHHATEHPACEYTVNND